jgi:hypothetical protein
MLQGYIQIHKYSHRIGTVIQDEKGIKWQLIKENKWILYMHSYSHKNKHNLKTDANK